MDSRTRQSQPAKASAGQQAKVIITGKGQSQKQSPRPPTPQATRTSAPPAPTVGQHNQDRSKNSLVFIPIDSLWSEPSTPPHDIEQRIDRSSRPSTRETSRSQTSPESLYRILYDSMYEAAIITNLSGIVSDANARAGELTGLHPLRLCGQPIENFVLGMDELMIHRVSDHVQMGRFAVLEGLCQRADGDQVMVELAVSRISRTSQQELLFSLRNQTHRGGSQGNDKIERRILHHAPCGIALVDQRKRIQYVNPAFLRMWRHQNAAAVVGKTVFDIWPDEIASLFLTPLQTGAAWAGDISVTRPDGRIKSFQSNVVPYPGPEGQAAGVLMSFIDITSLKSAQNAVRRETESQLRHASETSDFSGSLNIVAISDLIKLIASSSKTGTLEIVGPRDEVIGGASFQRGQVVFAQFQNLHGEPAVLRMLSATEGTFRFRNNHVAARDDHIRRTTLDMLNEASKARKDDSLSVQDDSEPLPVL